MEATLLHLAAFDGDSDAVNWLLSEGADIEARTIMDETPLMLAAMCGNVDIVHMLLKWGADSNAVPQSGYTAFKQAIKNGHAEIAQLLLARGADPAVVSSESAKRIINRTSEMIVQMVHLRTLLGSQYFHGRALQHILKKYKKRSYFPSSDLLTLAIQSNDFETVELTLNLVNLREAEEEKEDFWALDVARQSGGYWEIMHLLLEHGANPQVRVGAFSLLEYAVARQDRELVEVLLDAGANTETIYTKGLLSIAEIGEDTAMFELLQKRGVTDTCPEERTAPIVFDSVLLDQPEDQKKAPMETQYLEAAHKIISSVFANDSKAAFERDQQAQKLKRYGNELLAEINGRRKRNTEVATGLRKEESR